MTSPGDSSYDTTLSHLLSKLKRHVFLLTFVQTYLRPRRERLLSPLLAIIGKYTYKNLLVGADRLLFDVKSLEAIHFVLLSDSTWTV